MMKVIIFILSLIFGHTTMPIVEHIQTPKLVYKVDQNNNAIQYITPVSTYTNLYIAYVDNITLIQWTDGTELYANYEDTDNELYIYLKDGQSNQIYVLNRYYFNAGYSYTLSSIPVGIIVDNHDYNRTTWTDRPLNVSNQTISYTDLFTISYENDISSTQNIYLIGANDIESAYQRGLEDGENDVLTSPSNWNLYTDTQYMNYGEREYQRGYDRGIEIANDFSFFGLISAIMTAPALFVKEAFNFEFFGINISNLIMFFISLSIVIWIIGFFKKR